MTARHSFLFRRLLPLAALAVSAASCRETDSAAKRAAHVRRATGDVVIGVAWPWSAYRDIRFADGLTMAVDEVNASGGILGRQLRLQREDDHGSVDEGRLVAQRLGNNADVVAVIGHLQSYVSVPAAAIYDLSGVVMLAPTATDPELTAQGYRRVFRATFTNKTVGSQMATYAASRGFRRVAIYYIRDGYGRGLANAFEERATEVGIAVAARQSYDGSGQPDVRAFEAIANEWRGLDIDAIFLAGEVPSAATFIETARRVGITIPILGGDAMNSPELLRIGAAAEGTVIPSVFHPDAPRPEVRRFVDAFTRITGAAPDAGAALGYDAVWLLANAMRRAKSTLPDAIAASLHATKGWTGVTGNFTFTTTGDLAERPLVRLVVRRGAFAYEGDAQLAIVPARP